MDQRLDFEELTRQTRRLEFDDGLTDLQVSALFLFMSLAAAFVFSTAGLTWFAKALILQREITFVALAGIFACFTLVAFGSRRLIARVRRDYFWKDRGEIVPLPVGVDRWVSVLSAAVFLILTIFGLWLLLRGGSEDEAILRLIIAASGVATGITYLGMGRSLRLNRYLCVGIAGGLLSVVLFFVPLTYSGSWLGLGAIWTTILLASGLYALRRTRRGLAEANHG
ncbi:MAG: hypothetical protein MUP44_02140 [Anaerolineales bacterium]|nr:hypothetical protein [Anaerolineales bacterium]